MRIVLDTNVFVSGVFWQGPPARVLRACSERKVVPVLSPSIIDEYRRVGLELAERFPAVDLEPVIDAFVALARVVGDSELPSPACDDPDDDKFLAAAVAARAAFVVSGDKALLRVREYQGVRVVTASQFRNACLKG
jgi:putative PIN family toxin of toxin-antitoxin system